MPEGRYNNPYNAESQPDTVHAFIGRVNKLVGNRLSPYGFREYLIPPQEADEEERIAQVTVFRRGWSRRVTDAHLRVRTRQPLVTEDGSVAFPFTSIRVSTTPEGETKTNMQMGTAIREPNSQTIIYAPEGTAEDATAETAGKTGGVRLPTEGDFQNANRLLAGVDKKRDKLGYGLLGTALHLQTRAERKAARHKKP